MRNMNDSLKSISGAVVAAVVFAVFSLSGFAAPEPASVSGGTRSDAGTLSGTGRITINGNAAQTGATILSGSTVTTGGDGIANIEFGALGRVILRPNTTATLVFGPTPLRASLSCPRTRVEVVSGRVEAASTIVTSLSSGESDVFSGPIEIVSTVGSEFTLDCGSGNEANQVAGAYIGPGVLGVLALVTTAAVMAISVAAGKRGRRANPPLPEISPSQP